MFPAQSTFNVNNPVLATADNPPPETSTFFCPLTALLFSRGSKSRPHMKGSLASVEIADSNVACGAYAPTGPSPLQGSMDDGSCTQGGASLAQGFDPPPRWGA
jgi:hypothetical protein